MFNSVGIGVFLSSSYKIHSLSISL